MSDNERRPILYHHYCASQPLLSLIQGASLFFRDNCRPVAVAAIAAGLLLFGGCRPDGVQENQRPWPPSVVAPELVLFGQEAGVEVTCYDPDGGRVRVYVAWGDGDTSDFGEFILSGQAVRFYHTYGRADTFELRAQCHDLAPLFSEWSSPRLVVVANP